MNCIAKMKFKSIEKKDGGEFTNDRGQKITYDESYTLKVDEQTENGIYERRFKIPKLNVSLVDTLKALKPYDEITLKFDIQIFGNNVRIVPIGITNSNNK